MSCGLRGRWYSDRIDGEDDEIGTVTYPKRFLVAVYEQGVKLERLIGQIGIPIESRAADPNRDAVSSTGEREIEQLGEGGYVYNSVSKMQDFESWMTTASTQGCGEDVATRWDGIG